MKRPKLTFLVLALPFILFSQAETDVEVGVIEHLDEFIPMDAMLVDEHGDTVIIALQPQLAVSRR